MKNPTQKQAHPAVLSLESQEEKNAPPLKILCIGEELEVLQEVLSEWDCDCILFKQGLHAYQWIQRLIQRERRATPGTGDLPDAILCAYRFRDGSAVSMIQQLLLFKEFEPIPFVVMVNSALDHSHEALLQYGIDDVYQLSDPKENLKNRLDFLVSFKSQYLHMKVKDAARDFKLPVSKRVFDIVVASVGLVLTAPLSLLIALLIKLGSHGPVLEISKKVGHAYRIFNFYKFRTSHHPLDQPEETRPWEGTPYVKETLKGIQSCLSCALHGKDCVEPVTRGAQMVCGKHIQNAPAPPVSMPKKTSTLLGKWLRRTGLDEIPQLIHVLRGEMSIVGNRPLPLEEAERLTRDEWALRFRAPSGITGLWQVKSRFNVELNDASRKEIDILYAQKANFWMDCKILLLTIPALFKWTDY